MRQTTHMSADAPPPRARPFGRGPGHVRNSSLRERRPGSAAVRPLLCLAAPLMAAALLAGCGGSHPAASSTGTASSTTLGPGDVAVVGGEHVTRAMYDEALTEDRVDLTSSGTAIPAPGTSGYTQMRSAVINALVEEMELGHAAQSLGVVVTQGEVTAQLERFKQQQFGGSEAEYTSALAQRGLTTADLRQSFFDVLLQNKIDSALAKTIKISPAQISRYYNKNIERYELPPSRRVREILAVSKSLAFQIYRDLKGGASFATLANRYSAGPALKGTGGLFTAVDGTDVAAFDEAVFAKSSATGKLLPPIYGGQYGWFLILPLAPIVAPATTPEAKVAGKIRATLAASKKSGVIESWFKRVARSYCSAGSITYASGYAPSPNPCTALLTTRSGAKP